MGKNEVLEYLKIMEYRLIDVLSTPTVIGPPAMAGRVLWNRVCLSFHPSFSPSFCPFVYPGFFLEIVSLVFSKFWHGARKLYKVVHDRARFSRKNFPQKVWGNGPKMGQK